MLVRKIKPQDDAAVATLIRSVMTEFGAVGPGFSIEDPEVDAMFEAYAQLRARFYVIEDNGKVVGCGGIAPLAGGDRDDCELKKMYFLAETRGRGLGRLLTETLLADAQRIGFRRVYIETLERMTIANLLYQKLGFERLAQGLGNTGHCGCDTYYAKHIPPLELDPSLLA